VAKFIFITGGVVSGLGKGITAASLGRLLKARGFSVTAQKLDPYLNVDPGTMSPLQHGEVFVTDDGAETDLDLGHYERFMDVSLGKLSNATTGKIYGRVIEKERRGDYLGGTVQVIPHVTNEIKDWIKRAQEASGAEILICEIGGTVGDIESLPFLEAIRQLKYDVGRQDALYIHVTLVPYLEASGEAKTKPTQHSVKELRSIGITPDIIVARSQKPLAKDLLDKIALFCDVEREAVVPNPDAPGTIYAAPLILEEAGLGRIVCEKLGLQDCQPDLRDWRAMVERRESTSRRVRVALVGKYVALHDAYLSVAEALHHAGIHHGARVEIDWVDSERLEDMDAQAVLAEADGVLVPGGFGARGVEGKIQAIRYAREEKVPFLGLCLGMQAAVIEVARDAMGLAHANTTEIDVDTPDPVIDLMADQADVEQKGGTMRLGAYPCRIAEGSLAAEAYGEDMVYERHRHRFEVNNAYREGLEAAGFVACGQSPDGRLVEMMEMRGHPFFLGTQFHPELRSRPNRPHPLFRAFVGAALERRESRTS